MKINILNQYFLSLVLIVLAKLAGASVLNDISKSNDTIEIIVRSQNRQLKKKQNLEFIHISQFEPKFMEKDSSSWSNFAISLIRRDSVNISLGLFKKNLNLPNTCVLIFSNGSYLGEARPGKKWKIDSNSRVFSESLANFLYQFSKKEYFVKTGGNVGQIEQLYCFIDEESFILLAHNDSIYRIWKLKSYIHENWPAFKELIRFKTSIAG